MKRSYESLTTLLSCLDDPRPFQATLVPPSDLPRPWSVAALANAIGIPVMKDENHKSLGYVHIVPTDAEGINPWLLTLSLQMSKATNPLGLFIIMYVNTRGLNESIVQAVLSEFFSRLGTTRVIQLFPFKDASVAIADSYDWARKKWDVQGLFLPEFCSGQRDERTKKLLLTTKLQQLKGSRYGFLVPEQNMWMNKRGAPRMGGREVMFAMLLLDHGMIWVPMPNSSSMGQSLAQSKIDIGLNVNNIAVYWSEDNLDIAEFSAVTEQVMTQ